MQSSTTVFQHMDIIQISSLTLSVTHWIQEITTWNVNTARDVEYLFRVNICKGQVAPEVHAIHVVWIGPGDAGMQEHSVHGVITEFLMKAVRLRGFIKDL